MLLPNDPRWKTAGWWDRSVLPLTPAELADMDDDERRGRLAEELNRSADLLGAVMQAFQSDLGSDWDTLNNAYRDILKVTRKHR